MNSFHRINVRILFIFSAICLLFLIISVRVFTLQIPFGKSNGGSSYLKKEKILSERGNIFDRDGVSFTRNLPFGDLIFDRYHIKEKRIALSGISYWKVKEKYGDSLSKKEFSLKVKQKKKEISQKYSSEEISDLYTVKLVSVLAPYLSVEETSLLEKVSSRRLMEVTLKRKLVSEDLKRVESLLHDNYMRGIRLKKGVHRWYVMPYLATHVLGFVNREGVARSGVEKWADEFLKGKDGHRIYKKSLRGKIISTEDNEFLQPISGGDVYLTIDVDIQSVVEEELDLAMDLYNPKRASVVVMSPKTGEILAMASRPHYNLNSRDNLQNGAMNYAVQGLFEPGSTFKIIPFSAALEEGKIDLDTIFDCSKGLYSEGRLKIRDYKPYEFLTAREVIQKSSNIGTYLIAKELGVEIFYTYAKKFGFGKLTQLEFPQESSGILRESHNLIDFSRASFGYGLQVTPLQLACAYSAIANGGKWLRPRLIKNMGNNKEILMKNSREEHSVLSEETCEKVREVLGLVVQEGGTAVQASVDGYFVGGKTGTSQKYDPNIRKYAWNKHIASFVGMMPLQNPEIVCVVVVDEPRTKQFAHYGGTIAAPLFSRIASKIAVILDLPSTKDKGF